MVRRRADRKICILGKTHIRNVVTKEMEIAKNGSKKNKSKELENNRKVEKQEMSIYVPVTFWAEIVRKKYLNQ